jgi:hypothetical protein
MRSKEMEWRRAGIMGIKDGLQKIRWGNLVKFAPLVVFGLWSVGFAWVLWAEPAGQKTFSSPDEASRTLFRAVQAGSDKDLLEIFGPDGKEIISSGDKAEDRKSREMFAEKYQRMNRLVKEPDGTVTLYLGAENWPLPIPLTSKDNRWYFDTSAGKEEILFRQIGRNEMTAIRVLHELVDAEKEYYSETRDGNARQYAEKLSSDDGKRNGLYWKTQGGEPESPIGPHLAYAEVDNEMVASNSGAGSFNGYYFCILSKQGASAPGGAKNYIIDGRMTGGFGFVAYPAEYGVSGIMTFMVGQDGVVYQKNLGPQTTALAKAVREYNPDKEWERVD